MAVLASTAAAELVAKGDLFIRFEGGIAPTALPRHSLAPVAVRIGGRIRVPSRQDPPALRWIQVALNRNGHLQTRGLPTCRRGEIALASAAQALAACGPALVGGGGFTGRSTLEGQPPVTFPGQILLFNGRSGGRRVILAHVSQTTPVAIDRVVVFRIRRSHGTFGTVLTGSLPPSINRNGYLTSIFLQLQRRYVYRGRRVAYLSADCPVPQGFTKATFPFARATVRFSDGRTLSATMTRTCTVR